MTGSGTQADPYIIYNVTDLQNIELDLTAYYELANDIDASETSGWNAGAGFVPIGRFSPYFTGHFDGKGYTISDLFENRGILSASLFDVVIGTVQNLGLVDCDLTTTGFLGGFCGTNEGTISKCYITGALVAGGFAGAFVQWNEGTIQHCYSRASLTGDGANFIAGFVQRNAGVGTIDDCYSTGAVTNGGGGTREAGFCQSNAGGPITNCFWDTETSGQAASDGGTGKTTAEMKTKSTFADAGWDFTTPIWYIHPTINDGYPAFIGVSRIKGNPHIDQLIYQHVERM